MASCRPAANAESSSMADLLDRSVEVKYKGHGWCAGRLKGLWHLCFVAVEIKKRRNKKVGAGLFLNAIFFQYIYLQRMAFVQGRVWSERCAGSYALRWSQVRLKQTVLGSFPTSCIYIGFEVRCELLQIFRLHTLAVFPSFSANQLLLIPSPNMEYRHMPTY